MSHHNGVIIPTKFGIGSSGGPGFYSNVIPSDSGRETIVRRRQQARWRFDMQIDSRKADYIQELMRFYLCRGGISNTFLYKHWLEHNSTQVGFSTTSGTGPATNLGAEFTHIDQVLGVGDGVKTEFQLTKRFNDGNGYSYIKTITKPIGSTLKVGFNGADLAADNGSNNWSVNEETGMVTFDTAVASPNILTAGFDYHFPVRFDDQVDELFAAAATSKVLQEIVSVPLVEELVTNPVKEGIQYGGSTSITMVSNVTLDGLASSISLLPQSGSLRATLPDSDLYPGGGPIFGIINSHGSNSVIISTIPDAAFHVLAPGESTAIWNGEDSGGNTFWYRT